LFCAVDPQWVTVEGAVALEPPESRSILHKVWKIVLPTDAGMTCPSGWSSPCNNVNFTTEFIEGQSTFSITGWWPGIRPSDTEVKLDFAIDVEVLDANGNPARSGNEIRTSLYYNRAEADAGGCPVNIDGSNMMSVRPSDAAPQANHVVFLPLVQH
jgi:hypothetical protein